MKNVIITIAILSTLGILLRTSQAAAEKRVIIIEIGESGQTVKFPMSPAEIASEDAENTRLAVLKKSRSSKSMVAGGEFSKRLLQ